ncbi:MAG TPA: hypothetical protein VMW48_20510, partial [Vicinamibacterales bacterium]|nr:hypothetical protein [Vicinamibacterales bacterium]
LADEVLKVADVPVDTGGLRMMGDSIAYVDGKRVGGVAAKPKAFKVRGQGVSVAVGYPFPARFNEMGTVKQPPRPFLAPAIMATAGSRSAVEGAMKVAMKTHLSKREARLFREARRAARPGRPVGKPFDFGQFMSMQKGFVK